MTAPKTLDWKYHVIHTWASERLSWAEALLLPDDPAWIGEALWFTLDGLHDSPGAQEWLDQALAHLDGREFWVRDEHSEMMGDADMIVRAQDFSKEEFLEWMRVWIREKGMPVGELREAPFVEFEGRHAMADFVSDLQARYPVDSDAHDEVD